MAETQPRQVIEVYANPELRQFQNRLRRRLPEGFDPSTLQDPQIEHRCTDLSETEDLAYRRALVLARLLKADLQRFAPDAQAEVDSFVSQADLLSRLLVRRKTDGRLDNIVLQFWGAAIPQNQFIDAYGDIMTVRPVAQPGFGDKDELTFKVSLDGKTDVHFSRYFTHIENKEKGSFVYLFHIDPSSMVAYLRYLTDLSADDDARDAEFWSIQKKIARGEIRDHLAFYLWNAAIRLSQRTLADHIYEQTQILTNMRYANIGPEERDLLSLCYLNVTRVVRDCKQIDPEGWGDIYTARELMQGVASVMAYSKSDLRNGEDLGHSQEFRDKSPKTFQEHLDNYVRNAAYFVKMHLSPQDPKYVLALNLKETMLQSKIWKEEHFKKEVSAG